MKKFNKDAKWAVKVIKKYLYLLLSSQPRKLGIWAPVTPPTEGVTSL